MKSLVKTLQLLKLFTSEKAEWGIGDMVQELGYHKSSVQRIVDTLEAGGVLSRTIQEKRIYRLGPEILFLGNVAEFSLDIRSIARPIMVQLVDRVHETSYLCIVDQCKCLYIEKIECSQPIRTTHSLGERNFMHCTGVGKALLIGMTNEQIDRIIAETGLKRHTPSTITDRDRLLREIECARKEGVAYDNEELTIGVRCIAAPIFNRKGRVAASISVSGPAQRFMPDAIARMEVEVKKAAQEISMILGSPVGPGRPR
jgi:IclR family transcriptional regulator, KDG regulon repressor